MLNRLLIAGLFMILCQNALSVELYRWKDENGRIHYSDERPPSQVKVEIMNFQVKSYEGPAEIVKYKKLSNTINKELNNTTNNEPGKVSSEILMYSAEWCGVCTRAKNFMNDRGIAYTNLDVDKNKKARREFKKLKGTGVPVILVGSQRMNGFNPDKLMSMIDNN
jgi:glutaredoxin